MRTCMSRPAARDRELAASIYYYCTTAGRAALYIGAAWPVELVAPCSDRPAARRRLARAARPIKVRTVQQSLGISGFDRILDVSTVP
jgi:hypothetical protein